MRTAVELGVRHIDTSDFYRPAVVNELIREALHPYPGRLPHRDQGRGPPGRRGRLVPSLDPDDLKFQVHENLRHLGLDTLNVVNLRVAASAGGAGDSIAEPFGGTRRTAATGPDPPSRAQRSLGRPAHRGAAHPTVATVQNFYNLADRHSAPLVGRCASQHITFVPYFPLGGFRPLRHDALLQLAGSMLPPQQVALAWLSQRSRAIALIPGTSPRSTRWPRDAASCFAEAPESSTNRPAELTNWRSWTTSARTQGDGSPP
ncbi:oxidoreductase [Streptomyces sp. CA-210063]|uniref:oxidoreductase n=1 Tax=Streptomyces sp. CA-210063 TaxID=2801029 RepID=UPI00214C276D|nr:oxidoreductase [Streptomyces sp. CA-210063]UUU29346.1 oxidoreductase [Streptomyces sp. CA-210063]